MYTGGGCCDCGDETAWKQNGFVRNIKELNRFSLFRRRGACTVGPVLDRAYLSKTLNGGEHVKVEASLTSTVVEMLLEFCKHSESLLSFVSRRIFRQFLCWMS
ncbi:hypothetical protein MKW92_031865 [Papaver armeniacum]|nr:hypothetical protein MKW92_031865 [Papaver armeniacum]